MKRNKTIYKKKRKTSKRTKAVFGSDVWLKNEFEKADNWLFENAWLD